MTIASEGRETWAAGSLRGSWAWVGWAGFCGDAGLVWRLGFGTYKRPNDGHVSTPKALGLGLWERRETDLLAGGFQRVTCRKLVKSSEDCRETIHASLTGREQDLIKLESLILAQNERWRQA